MRKVFYVLTLTILFAEKISGQSIGQQVISSSGNFLFAGNNSLSFTVGEIAVQTLTSSSILTQGFQQPNDMYLAVENIMPPPFQVDVYPNPTQDNLFVKLYSNSSSPDATVRLMDMVGRILFETNIHSFETEVLNIPMQNFSAGTYLLSISDKLENISSYKIIKFQ